MIISEKLKLDLNVDKIFSSIQPLLRQYPSVQRSHAIGGWALQSTNGSYQNGWTTDFCPYNGPQNLGPSWNPRNDYERTLKTVQDFVFPTEINSDEIQSTIMRLEELGLNPRRARIIKLSANSDCRWHQDGHESIYQVRLHIPLITNAGCFFETQDGTFHMPADGSAYLVHINKPHRVINRGNADRYHFVCHVWDTRKITLFHQYDAHQNLVEAYHPAEKV